MTITDLSHWVHQTIELHGSAEIGQEVLHEIFTQRERHTAFGDALCDLAGIPNEEETFRRWVQAQGLRAEFAYPHGCWTFSSRRPASSSQAQ